jgi:hypothetical protein
MHKTRYILLYGKKRQEAVVGRADRGPKIKVGFGDSVFKHVPVANSEGAWL